MNKIKRIISLLLATVLLFTISSSFVYAAPSDTVEYGSINYTYMNAEQKTGTIKARKQNDHIYCNADFIGALLG